MRLEVDSGGYDSAAEALEGGNLALAGGYTSLTGKLGGYSSMAGDDTSSEDFVKNYDSAAADTVAAFAELTTAYGNLALLTATSGANHREANRQSVYKKGDRPAGDDKEPQPEIVSIYTPPSSLGGDNADMPEFWNLIVDHLQGYAWPSADTGKLREAASTWRAAAGTIDRAPSYATVASSQLGRQRSPEIAFARPRCGSCAPARRTSPSSAASWRPPATTTPSRSTRPARRSRTSSATSPSRSGPPP